MEAAVTVVVEESQEEVPKRVIASLLESRDYSDKPTKSGYLYLAKFNDPILEFKAKIMSRVEYVLKHAKGEFADVAVEYKKVIAYLHFIPVESEFNSKVKSQTRTRGLIGLVATFAFFFILGNWGPSLASQILFVLMTILLPVVSKVSRFSRLTWLNPDIFGRRLSLGGTLAMVSLSGNKVVGGGTSAFSGSNVSPIALVDLILLVWILYGGINLVYRITSSVFPPTEEAADLASQVVSYSTTGAIAYSVAQVGLLSNALFLPLGSTTTLAVFGGFSVAILALRTKWNAGVAKQEREYVKKKRVESEVFLFKSMTNTLLEESDEVSGREVFNALEEKELQLERTSDLPAGVFKTLESEGRGTVKGEGAKIKIQRIEPLPQVRQQFVAGPKKQEQETPQMWAGRLVEAAEKGVPNDISGRLSMRAYGEPWYRSLMQGILCTKLGEEQLKSILLPSGPAGVGGLAASQIGLTCLLRDQGRLKYEVTDPEEKNVRELVMKFLCTGIEAERTEDGNSTVLTYRLDLGGEHRFLLTFEAIRGPDGEYKSTAVSLMSSSDEDKV